MALAAEDHCNYQGPRGELGHTGKNRSQPWDRAGLYGKWDTIGENIAYGRSEGDEFMLQLYIDDGVPNRGHRKNMLSERFKQTGIAACDHKHYGKMMVALYAGNLQGNEFGD